MIDETSFIFIQVGNDGFKAAETLKIPFEKVINLNVYAYLDLKV